MRELWAEKTGVRHTSLKSADAEESAGAEESGGAEETFGAGESAGAEDTFGAGESGGELEEGEEFENKADRRQGISRVMEFTLLFTTYIHQRGKSVQQQNKRNYFFTKQLEPIQRKTSQDPSHPLPQI